jgi:hypothetical protein
MRTQAKGFAVIIGMTVLSGCLGSAPRNGDGTAHRPRAAGAITIEGEQLWAQKTDLMTAVKNRVASMEVGRSSTCPRITIRGQKSVQGPSDPRIYVDGMPAVNTCILDMLNTLDVELVEVYPGGVTRRPGYPADPYGLILVFSRRAEFSRVEQQ